MKTVDKYGSVLRCYDNGGKTLDRYTVLPPRWGNTYRNRTNSKLFESIAASENPYHPQGVGQHTLAYPGKHLGKRIHWDDLPTNVQTFAKSAFPEYICP